MNGMSATRCARATPRATMRAVIDHLVERHGQRGALALDHHPQAVADQHDVDAGPVGQAREDHVVGGQDGDLARRSPCARAASPR